MAGNLAKWPSERRKTKKSDHRMAAKGIRFTRRWNGGMIPANLEVTWKMSVYLRLSVIREYHFGASW